MKYENFDSAIQRLEAGIPNTNESGIFGANLNPDECKIVLLSAPWDGTASYHKGTAQGPKAICEASHQLDYEDPCFGAIYKKGIAHIPPTEQLKDLCQNKPSTVEEVNKQSNAISDEIYQQCMEWLNRGKKVGLIGGEHSVSLGAIKAVAEHTRNDFSILHIDAHFDLRDAYEGYQESHASVMFNAKQSIPQITRIVHVGIRDYSHSELQMTQEDTNYHKVFLDREIYGKKANGTSFSKIATEICDSLSNNIYISFDIDGLEPSLCPNTGTPVPGGLNFHECNYILETLHIMQKNVLGFDLVEVAPGANDWDANVGARVLYKLCGLV